MIKIFLKEELERIPEIKEIVEEVATKVLNECVEKNIDLQCIYNGKSFDLNDKQNLKQFFSARDFYEYEFADEKEKSIREAFEHSRKMIQNVLKRENNFWVQETPWEKDIVRLLAHGKVKETDRMGQVIRKLMEPENAKNLKSFVLKAKVVFDYDNMIDSEQKVKIINAIGQEVCPYCNMTYIKGYFDGERKWALADLDHFYLKSIYPEYSLCLYNFIPCCINCNSRLKRSKNMDREKYIYPYQDSFEGKADFKVGNLGKVLLEKQQLSLELDIYKDLMQRVKNSSEIFQIEERYKEHTDKAEDLIEKAMFYKKEYRSEIEEMLKERKFLPIKRMVFGKEISEEDMTQIAFGKLKRDILRQLGIYRS